MSTLSGMLVAPGKSPFLQGKEAAIKGSPAPSFPGGDATWAQKLYARGYDRGCQERDKTAKI